MYDTTEIKFGNRDYVYAAFYQYDTGQKLSFPELPDGTEVQFDEETTKIVTDGIIMVPSVFLETDGTKVIFVQVVTSDSETTIKKIIVSVMKRFEPSSGITPEEEQTFREYVTEMMQTAASIAQSVRDDADNGAFDGFSPTVETAQIEGGHRVTITDESGDHSFDVLDGGGGTGDHSRLTHRSDDDQHPMSAITGLNSALAGKQPAGDYALRSEIPSVAGLASESWVQSQGYLTQHQDISGKADTSYVDSEISRVEGEIPSLSGYATETYVDTAIATAIAGVDDLIGSGVI